MPKLQNLDKIPIVLALLAFFIIPLTTIVALNSQDIRQKASMAGEAVMFLDPVSITTQVGEEVIVKVYVNTSGSQIEGADIALKYDPNYLELVDNTINPGLVLESYTGRTVDARKGMAFIRAVGGSYQGVRGKLAEATFKTKQSGITQINLYQASGGLQECAVWQSENGGDILGATMGSTIEIN